MKCTVGVNHRVCVCLFHSEHERRGDEHYCHHELGKSLLCAFLVIQAIWTVLVRFPKGMRKTGDCRSLCSMQRSLNTVLHPSLMQFLCTVEPLRLFSLFSPTLGLDLKTSLQLHYILTLNIGFKCFFLSIIYIWNISGKVMDCNGLLFILNTPEYQLFRQCSPILTREMKHKGGLLTVNAEVGDCWLKSQNVYRVQKRK